LKVTAIKEEGEVMHSLKKIDIGGHKIVAKVFNDIALKNIHDFPIPPDLKRYYISRIDSGFQSDF